ncbi:MAG TPA: carboxypeptidase regulatory-like domain-containing protein [Pyrinomonadaceae bacterium]|nr:carboxypeptidase regulatory-like domain-containing protein [Pyrinomonadaceae bacterium]
MNVSTKFLRPCLGIALVMVLSSVFVLGQQARGSLRGVIQDELGATIVGATVTLTGLPDGVEKTATTNGEGVYVFNGLAPGKYLVRATAPGFGLLEDSELDLTAGQRATMDLTLKVTIEEQKVTIAAETPLSTEATDNANQTKITGKDLDALPDDPDELAAALQALAGPSMGPNGGQIFVDGFSGGRMPSKDSIREIRINQNPFSAENDQASGRIEILTRPGTDKLRGSTFFNFEDESLNSRNPFSNSRTPYQIRSYGGNLGGPLVAKKASFFIDFDRRETDDNELVTVRQLDSNLNPFNSGFGVVVPRRNISFGPRFDYQLNPNNTLVARYNYNRFRTENSGVGGFSLPERGYDTFSTNHSLTLTETAVLNASMISETRFQYNKSTNERFGDSSLPVLQVSGAFTSGGSQVGHALNSSSRWELQNFLNWQRGTHSLKFGGKVRGVSISDSSPSNFGGQYVFTGGFVPTLDANNNPITTQPVFVDSLERYRRTLLGQRLGRNAAQIRAMGGGASQFSISSGNPDASVSQIEAGLYMQDDWRLRPNLTLGIGLRYENQTNISSKYNFAPRLFMAWSPGAANSTRPPSMVIRVGAGVFYNRFGEGNILNANRFNGTTQQQFFVTERPLYESVNGILQFSAPAVSPLDVYPAIPSVASLNVIPRAITWRVADNLQAPAVYVAGVQVERQLPYKFTMFTGFYSIHIQHVIRARDINAPLPGTISSLNPNGTRPLGNIGEVYQYESSGRFDQNQWFIGFNNRFNRTISFSANYSLSKTENDTDGQGGGIFPVNSYDLTGEYGRAGFDIRHRFSFFGSINLPWQVSLTPLINYTSGRPFNITTGQDTNLDRQFTERPSFAAAGVDCAHPAANIICTPFGNFNRNPAPGEALIPRNYGEGPAFLGVNMRISKTWTFGSTASSRAAAAKAKQAGGTQAENTAGGRGNRGGGEGGGVPRIPDAGGGGGGPRGGGGGGPRGGGGGGMGGMGGMGVPGGGGGEAKRYSMQFSINFQNILNKVNLGNPEGNLSSPSFGQSLSLNGAGGFGGGGGGGGGAGNRRVSAQVRFNF